MPLILPILYSFRRCPYAIRARMAIAAGGQRCALREVILRNKPSEMIVASPKGTVPVVILPDGRVIEESLDIMYWALENNDPAGWLAPFNDDRYDIHGLIKENDRSFKNNLDRYKYPTRYEGLDPLYYRTQGMVYLKNLNARLLENAYLCGNEFSFADAAISPFIRQFANHDREWFNTLDLYALQNWLETIVNDDKFLGVMKKYPAWERGMEEPVFP